MPSGIVLKSASHEVSEEVRQGNLNAVIEAAGFELPEAEPPAEPKREDFKTDEDFEAAHVDWQDKEEEKSSKGAEEEAPAPKKSRKDRWVARATVEKDRRIKELEERLAAAEASKEESSPAKQDEAPIGPARPKRADFDTDEDFAEAFADWRDKTKAQQAAEAQQKAELEANLKSWKEDREEGRTQYADWEEVVNQDIPMQVPVQHAIMELKRNFEEAGNQVVYYLGRHPSYAKKLMQLPPLSAVMEVGRLSQRLNGETGASATDEANGKGQPKPRPKVPAPVRTVNTGGSSGALTFKEIAAKPDYPGKAGDLKKALAEGRN